VRELIEGCRKQFGDPPREFGRAEQEELRLRLGRWRHFKWWLKGDKLCTILRDQWKLHGNGRVVWGYLVQVNKVLFRPANTFTCPGNAVYSPDPFFDDRLDALEAIGRSIFKLKGTQPTSRAARQFAEAVTDEMQRTMRLQIPEELCDGRTVYLTTLFFQPSHLPEGYMRRGFFPLLISPGQTDAVMVLPARYWPRELVRLWTED
jgi:hypothetical protein